ncbi:hypothetical protein [Leptospira santarosai]|uniref:hypothetical protein n=1 Tax=Leptospira santarosai TaxID=28183 RepID=UPI00209D2354|nr:hypothetical protein [Leptospira santarosai]
MSQQIEDFSYEDSYIVHHRLSNFSFLNGDSSATQHHNSEFTFKPAEFHYAGNRENRSFWILFRFSSR